MGTNRAAVLAVLAGCAGAALAALPPLPARAADAKAPAGSAKELSEKAAQAFKGKAEIVGKNVLRISYDFSSDEQLKDFNQACEGKIVDGQLELQPLGMGLSFWNVKGAVFEDSLSVETDVIIPSGSSGEAGLLFFFSTKQGEGYGFSLNGGENLTGRSKPCHYIRKWDTKTMGGHTYWNCNNLGTTSKPEMTTGQKYRWKAVARQGSLEMSLNGAPLLSKQDSSFREGLLCLCATKGPVRYDNIKIEGRVNPDWLRKALSEADTIASRKEMEGLHEKGEPVVIRVVPLSVETKTVLGAVDPGAVKAYEEGFHLQMMHQFDKAIELFTAALKTVPNFAAALYRRAECHAAKGQEDKAAQDLDDVIAKHPKFHEAYKERGDLFLARSLPEHALAEYNKALEIQPDYGGALAARAYLYFVQGDREKAVKAIEEAARVNSEDAEIQTIQKRLKRVAEGPTWAKEKTFVKETAHYVVKTDISDKAAAFYASQLEAIFSMYTSRFGYKAEQKQKGRAYIFETNEGYMTYAELSTSARPEHTLGYYHPHYKELLLFEGLDKELTLRVLYHEGFHQFLHQFLPNPPYWFNEGVAEFFGASRVEGGKVVATGLIQDGRLRDVQAMMGSNYLKSLPALLRSAARQDFYSGYIAANYAQAWSVIHFLFGYEGGKYAPLLREYYKQLRDGVSAKEAYEASFGKADVRGMEREWQEYVKKLEPSRK